MPVTSAAPFRLAVLVSGRGSNLGALIRAQESGELQASIAGVFSDRPNCAAISLAREHGLSTFTFRPADYHSRQAFDESMFSQIESIQPDLIVCAGYMRLISESAVIRCEGRMINIHPSLLPKYPGLDTHARALAAGDREHGASVHVLTPALDSGPVIAQARVAVLPEDTSASLARRVLETEHTLLAQCVKAIAQGKVRLSEAQIRWLGTPLSSPLSLNAYAELEESK